jgi:hypothetical protein
MSAPQNRVLAWDPDYDPDGEGLMEFRLTYAGPLLGSSRNNTRADHKHAIRKAFHRQLRTLWETYVPLRYAVPRRYQRLSHSHERTTTYEGTLADYLASIYRRGDYRFVPMVREELSLVCSLHVLFLRPDRPGAIVKSGDIDNRLKTLFDALRMPMSDEEMTGHLKPKDGEDPFYVLMEDDKLFTHVAIETDMLLEPIMRPSDPMEIEDSDHKKNDARLVITVKIRPFDANPSNAVFW